VHGVVAPALALLHAVEEAAVVLRRRSGVGRHGRTGLFRLGGLFSRSGVEERLELCGFDAVDERHGLEVPDEVAQAPNRVRSGVFRRSGGRPHRMWVVGVRRHRCRERDTGREGHDAERSNDEQHPLVHGLCSFLG